MTPEEIKEEYELRKDRIADLRGDIEIEWAYIKVLQKKCKHPNSYTYYAMGEAGMKCPDCGHQT